MSLDGKVDEKAPAAPSNESIDRVSGELSTSDELAQLALEKRVLRKTDMVVLPMVRNPSLSIQYFRL